MLPLFPPAVVATPNQAERQTRMCAAEERDSRLQHFMEDVLTRPQEMYSFTGIICTTRVSRGILPEIKFRRSLSSCGH